MAPITFFRLALASFISIAAALVCLRAERDIFAVYDGQAYALQDPYSDNASIVRSADGSNWEYLLGARSGIINATVLAGAVFAETEENTLRYDLATGETNSVPDTFPEGLPYYAHDRIFFHDQAFTLYQSTDGKDWQPFHRITNTEGVAYYLYTATDGNGKWVVAGNTDSPYSVRPYVSQSQDDGQTWSREIDIMLEETDFSRLLHDGKNFVLVADHYFFTSPDGIKWSLDYSKVSLRHNLLGHYDGQYHIKNRNQLFTAPNLKTPETDWTPIEFPVAAKEANLFYDFAQGRSLYTIVAQGDPTNTAQLYDPTKPLPVDPLLHAFIKPVADEATRAKFLAAYKQTQDVYQPQTLNPSKLALAKALETFDRNAARANSVKEYLNLFVPILNNPSIERDDRTAFAKAGLDAFGADNEFIAQAAFYITQNRSLDANQAQGLLVLMGAVDSDVRARLRSMAMSSINNNSSNAVDGKIRGRINKGNTGIPYTEKLNRSFLYRDLAAGYAGATHDLMFTHSFGIGTSQNLLLSRFWMKIAPHLGGIEISGPEVFQDPAYKQKLISETGSILAAAHYDSASDIERLTTDRNQANIASGPMATPEVALKNYFRESNTMGMSFADAYAYAKIADAQDNPLKHYYYASLAIDDQAPFKDYGTARHFFEKCLSLPNEYKWEKALANAYLGNFYRRGKGVPVDLAQAKSYFEKGAALENAFSAYFNGIALASAWDGEPDLPAALAQFKKAKELGYNAEDCDKYITYLEKPDAKAYSKVLPTGRQFFNVEDWHAKADTGDAFAAFELAYIHYWGNAVFKDRAVAEYWRQVALFRGFETENSDLSISKEKWAEFAEGGSPLAKAFHSQYVPNATPEEKASKFQLLDEAIEENVTVALHIKARALGTTDIFQAIELYEQAGASGYSISYSQLNSIFLRGDYVIKDYERAYDYAQKAPLEPLSQINLGWMYEKGHYVEQDYQRAASYYLAVLETNQGALAAYNLAKIMADGKVMALDDGSPNLEAALKNAKIAKEKGSKVADTLIKEINEGQYGLFSPELPASWTPGKAISSQPSFRSNPQHFIEHTFKGAGTFTSVTNFQGRLVALSKMSLLPADEEGEYLSLPSNASPSSLVSADDVSDPNTTWTWLGPLPFEPFNNTGIVSNDTHLLAYSRKNELVATTKDGANWTTHKCPGFFEELKAGPNGFYAITTSNNIYRSKDGSQWDLLYSASDLKAHIAPQTLKEIDYHNGLFIAYTKDTIADTHETIYVSEKGTTWYPILEDESNFFGLSNDVHHLSVPGLSVIGFTQSTSSFLGAGKKRGHLLFAHQNGNWSPLKLNNETNHLASLFTIDGHLFGVLDDDRLSAKQSLAYLKISSPNAKSSPLQASPSWVAPSQIFSGQQFEESIRQAIFVGNHLCFSSYTGAKLAVLPNARSTALPDPNFFANVAKPKTYYAGTPKLKYRANTTGDVAAFKQALAAADQGDAEAAYEVYRSIFAGTSSPVYVNESIKAAYLDKAVAGGIPAAQRVYADRVWYSEPEKALDLYQKAIAGGDVEAAYLLSNRIDYNKGWQGLNFTDAASFLKPFAENGDEKAESRYQYFKGAHAAKGGDLEAANLLIALIGDPVKRKHLPYTLSYGIPQAKEMLIQAGDAKTIQSEYEAAIQIANNDQNIKKWIHAMQGAGIAQGFFLEGQHRVQGSLGLKKNVGKAIPLYDKAAQLGYLPAIKDLVRVYTEGSSGIGIEADVGKAKTYLTLAKQAGETEWADNYQKFLDFETDRNAQRDPLNGAVSNLSKPLYDMLKEVQEKADWASIPVGARSNLFVGIWQDAQFSLHEEDLIQELLGSASFTVASEGQETFTFDKVPPEAEKEQWKQYYPVPFPGTASNYPIQTWSFGNTPGPIVYYCAHPIIGEQATNALAQVLRQETEKRVKTAQTDYNDNTVREWANFLVQRSTFGTREVQQQYSRIIYDIYKINLRADANLLRYFTQLNQLANQQN